MAYSNLGPKDLLFVALNVSVISAPDRIRTCGPQIRSLMLYPAELPGQGPRNIGGLGRYRKAGATGGWGRICVPCALIHNLDGILLSPARGSDGADAWASSDDGLSLNS